VNPCNTSCQNRWGDTALHEACRNKYLAAVEVLLTGEAAVQHAGPRENMVKPSSTILAFMAGWTLPGGWLSSTTVIHRVQTSGILILHCMWLVVRVIWTLP